MIFLSRCNHLPTCQVPVNSSLVPTSCPHIEKYLEVQFECQEAERRKSEDTKLSRFPRMERNIGHMWGNGGTVIASEMLGKAVRSIFEQESTLVHVTNSTDPIIESLDNKVNVTLSDDENKIITQKVNPKSHKELGLKLSYIELSHENSLHREETYNLQNMIILTTAGAIVGAVLTIVVTIKQVVLL